MANEKQGIRLHDVVNPELACEYRMDAIFACGVFKPGTGEGRFTATDG